MGKDKIDKTIEYYEVKIKSILKIVNCNRNLTVEDVIRFGEELSVLEHKLTALEIAKEN